MCRRCDPHANDCPDGRGCQGQAYCKHNPPLTLCDDTQTADAQCAGTAAEETCGPVAAFDQCTPDSVSKGGRGCGEFAQKCKQWCGSCGGAPADTCDGSIANPGYCAETTCSEDAGDGYPVGTLATTCTCRCNGVTGCTAEPSAKCTFLSLIHI